MDIKFVIALKYLDIKSNLRRGDKITDELYISNDSSILNDFIPAISKNVIGSLEYENLLNSKVFIYASGELPKELSINDYILNNLYTIQMFLSAIWVY